MKIKSKFSDYYDCMQSYGQDSDIIYNRFLKEEQIEVDIIKCNHYVNDVILYNGYVKHSIDKINNNNSFKSILDIRFDNSYVKSILIGFCGKIYPCIEIKKYSSEIGNHENFAYTIEEVDNIILNNFNKNEQENYFLDLKLSDEKSYIRENGAKRRMPILFGCRKILINYLDNIKSQIVDKNLFVDNLCPLFVINEANTMKLNYSITFNASLREFEFFRVFDPIQAFQEISMYLGNMAFPNKPMPKISDKDMVDIKGFDTKYGFRNRPKE